MKGVTLSVSIKKIINDVISTLKLQPSPEKKEASFWDYMKSQLYFESTWEQKDLKVIENEIKKNLSKLDKKELTEMWKSTDPSWEKIEADKKVDSDEMKDDLTNEILGQVMDRMDDNYSEGNYYAQSDNLFTVEDKPTKQSSEEDFDDQSEPTVIEDEDINIEEDSFEDEDTSEEDEDIR